LIILDSREGFTDEDRVMLDSIPADLRRIYVYNKIDLLGNQFQIPDGLASGDDGKVYVSAKTGAGMETLRRTLLSMAGWSAPSGEGVFMARRRHLVALTEAAAHLTHVDDLALRGDRLELLAEGLRLAQRTLSSITGEFTADDLLGEIFSRFCIGK
jgi:tRNA modification GTPase